MSPSDTDNILANLVATLGVYSNPIAYARVQYLVYRMTHGGIAPADTTVPMPTGDAAEHWLLNRRAVQPIYMDMLDC